VEHARQSGLDSLYSLALSTQALIDVCVGRVDAARAAAMESLQIARRANANAPLMLATATLGFLELTLGDPAAAHGHLQPLSELTVAVGIAEPGVVRFLPDEIEALIALGELEAARRLLLLFEERARDLDRVSARAAAGRCRGLLEAAEGDLDAARGSLAEALAQHARIDQPFELGRTLLVQGTVERRAKHRTPAREALTRALEIFDTLGARLWAEKAAMELARIPGRTRSPGELTETERRVAELVARGLSNKEVAGKLFVTVRAVEANLSKVYAKLGVRSRTELATRFHSTVGS
jgi:ATP/maltotriose-dependent transcriptional regulator MalT